MRPRNEKANAQKNTLLKTAQGNARPKFLREYFFLHPRRIFANAAFLNILFSPTHGLTASTTSCASNVNRFEQSVCGLQTTHLRTDSKAADNIRLKEINKKGALIVTRTFVLSIYICG